MCVYVYIYIYMCVCVDYIYIYIYVIVADPNMGSPVSPRVPPVSQTLTRNPQEEEQTHPREKTPLKSLNPKPPTLNPKP